MGTEAMTTSTISNPRSHGTAGRSRLRDSYDWFRTEKVGDNLSPKTLAYYDEQVLPFLAWIGASHPEVVEIGDLSGNLLAAFRSYQVKMERRLIGARTKEALDQARKRGVRLGGRPQVLKEIDQRILRRREEGASLQAIANELTAEGIPPPRAGQKWGHTTIRYVLRRHHLVQVDLRRKPAPN